MPPRTLDGAFQACMNLQCCNRQWLMKRWCHISVAIIHTCINTCIYIYIYIYTIHILYISRDNLRYIFTILCICMHYTIYVWFFHMSVFSSCAWKPHNKPCGRLWCWETRIRNLRTMDLPSRGKRAETRNIWWVARMEGWWIYEHQFKKQLESVDIIYVIYLYTFGMILTNMIRNLFSESPKVLSDWLFLCFSAAYGPQWVFHPHGFVHGSESRLRLWC